MEKISGFIVKYSKAIFLLFIALSLCCVWLMTNVSINADMSKYLPDDSPIKTGIEIIGREFPASSSFHLLFEGLSDSDKDFISRELQEIPHVTGISYDGTEKYNKDGYTLYVATLSAAPSTNEADTAISAVKDRFSAYSVTVSGDAAGNTAIDILPRLAGIAFLIIFIILLVMCESWIEPLIILFTIAIAVVLNMGTNIIFDSISSVTNAIAAVLQLVLSMDYSIMMQSRYRQEKEHSQNKKEAMAKAIKGAFMSITSSSVTTIVGMLALVFMSFTIGRDMGFVLAKGVFLSLICVFTVMPALLLMLDRAVGKTAKKALHIKMDKIGAASHKIRYAVPVVFIALFAASFFMRGNVGISYALTDYYKANQIFTIDNPIVVLYRNENEEDIAALIQNWERVDGVTDVSSYATVLGRAMNYQDIEFMTDEMKAGLASTAAEMAEGLRQLVGESFSRAVINTDLQEESSETFTLIRNIEEDLSGSGAEYYISGNSAIAYEMNGSFPSEMSRITILSVIAIFLVVAVAFRSLSFPLILVCVIQCAVFLTMGVAFLQGNSMYYLALIIVQCLLLGATVDYGILLSSCYREARETLDKKEAVISALNNSIHTIITSGLILVIVTSVLGILFRSSDPAISEILSTISVGGLCSMILVVFALPGVIVALDRFVR